MSSGWTESVETIPAVKPAIVSTNDLDKPCFSFMDLLCLVRPFRRCSTWGFARGARGLLESESCKGEMASFLSPKLRHTESIPAEESWMPVNTYQVVVSA